MRRDFTASEAGWLLGGKSELRAGGPLQWDDQNRNYTASLPLTARGVEAGEARFIYRIGKIRASEPTLLVSFRENCVYRLDINGSHREGTKVHHFINHIHRRRSSDDPTESFEPHPNGVPVVELGKRIPPATYRSILTGFAAPIGMDILDIEWSDPPEGRQP